MKKKIAVLTVALIAVLTGCESAPNTSSQFITKGQTATQTVKVTCG
jgi:hypothetical protein